MQTVSRRSQKTLEEYRHNIKLLKYYLKKEEKLNETLRYKQAKKTTRQTAQLNQQKGDPHPIYAMLHTVASLSTKVKQLGLSLGDVFRMADGQYRGEVTRQQFMTTVSRLRGNLEQGQINEMFYAIDSNLNGMLSSDEYEEFLNAHGGTDNKAALSFQREAGQRFLAALKKKNLKAQDVVGRMLNPIPIEDIHGEMKKLSMNGNHVMALLRMWDPAQSGLIKQETFLKSMATFKVKDQRQIQNEKMEKGIKELCVLFREGKVNPMEIFESSDNDGRQGISVAELQEGLRKLLPDETPYQIKKWVNLINLNNDSQISREQFVSAIRSFYSLQQIDNFSSQYEKLHPKLKKALEEEVPAEKTINELSIFIEDNGLTKTEVFHRIDLSRNGTLDKAELLQGLKSLGVSVGLIGKVLAVFDRDASGEVGLQEWLSILGEDLEMEDVDVPEEKPKGTTETKTKKGEAKKEGKKEDKKAQPKEPAKTIKQPQKKPVVAQKTTKNAKPEEAPKPPAKQEEVKRPLKDQDKNKTAAIKSSQKSAKQSKKQTKIVKKQAGRQQASKKFADEVDLEEEAIKQTYSDEEVSIEELQRQVGQIFARSPKKTKDLFSKSSRNGKKGLNERQLAQFLKQLKLKTPYDQKHVKKAFQDNCSNSGLITTEWFDKLVESYELNPKEQQTLQEPNIIKSSTKTITSKLPKGLDQQAAAKEKNLIKLSTNTLISKIPKVLDEKVEEDEYDKEEFDFGEDSNVKNADDKNEIAEVARGKDNPNFQQLTQEHKLQPQTMSDEGYKLRKLITCEEEIALLQGKYTTTSNSLKKNKKPFQDKSFATNLSSLTHLPPNQSQIPDVTLIKWKHYKQFYKNAELFKDSISPNDIRQGTLGDCYFLCSLAALAEYKNLIERLFEYYDTDNGYFLVWICIDGFWKLIELDGYIPVVPTGDRPAFSHGDQEELWVILLEKAYAKAYGNYEKINGGQPYEAIKDLTGAPGQSFCHRREEVKAEELWRKLDAANKEQFIMTCGTDVDTTGTIKMEGHSESVTNEGLVLGHAYSILDVREYKGQRLIQLRNPWGETEWKGDWSDKSKKWTEQARKELGYSVSAEDGIFWMPFQAYFQKYNTTAINYLRPNYFYSSQAHKAVKSLVLTVSQGAFSHGFVIASQRDHRKDGLAVNTPYKMNHIITLQYKKGKLVRQISNEKYLYQREGSAEIRADADSQMIVLINLEQPADLAICTYADTHFEFEVDQSEDRMLQYVQDIALMESRAKNVQTTPNMFKSWMTSVGEHAFMVFKSIAKKGLSLQVKLSAPKNLQVKGKGKQLDIRIQPGEAKSIKGKIINLKDPYSFGPMDFGIEEI